LLKVTWPGKGKAPYFEEIAPVQPNVY